MLRSWFSPVALALVGISLVGCVEQTDGPSEEDVKAARENVLTEVPKMKFVVNAELEDKLIYLGCDVDTDSVTPQKAFTITHYWKVVNPPGADWKMFVHLATPGNKKTHLNADHVPISGKYPVSAWKKGEIIRDIHRISVPNTWPADALELYVGMWKGPSRMKVVKGPKDDENRVLAVKLPVIGIVPPKEALKKTLLVRKIKNGSIKLDGKLDDAAWKDAASTGPFVRTMDGSKTEQLTTAKALWDDNNLYVAFDVEDTDIWTTLDKRDDKLWTQEAVEIFIDADGDGKTYVELQTNPKGALFDSYLPAYRKNENDFDSGAKVAVNVSGTLDKRDDKDKGWTAEMQIPLVSVKGKEKDKPMANVLPVVGSTWRVNFFRLDQPKDKPQVGAAWSPPMVGDFHALDRFANLIFADDKGQTPAAAEDKIATDKADNKTPDSAKKESNKKGEATPPAAPEKKAEPAAPHKLDPAKSRIRFGLGSRATKNAREEVNTAAQGSE